MPLIYVSTPRLREFAVLEVQSVTDAQEIARYSATSTWIHTWRNYGFGFTRLGQHGSGYVDYNIGTTKHEFIDLPPFPARPTHIMSLDATRQAFSAGQRGSGNIHVPQGPSRFSGGISYRVV